MSPFPIRSSRQKILWLSVVTLLYIVSIVRFNFLQGPPMWDEIHFWQTSLLFSDSLIPSISDFKQYSELSTPLPFMIFGALEYFFHQGIFAGRLLSLTLFMVVAFIIGWPVKEKEGRSIRCLIGLCLCTSYLSLNGRLYTEMITCTFVLLGAASYAKNRHLLSALAFVAAIACRQYMVVFPAAIALCEFITVFKSSNRSTQAPYSWSLHQRWSLPAIATVTLFGWIIFFGGLAAPATLLDESTPVVQQALWQIQPGGAVHGLAAVGGYIVIPELLLFSPVATFKKLLAPERKIAMIAAALLAYTIAFPPVFEGLGRLISIALILPHPLLGLILFYVLALLACIRFLEPSLMSFVVLFNTLIMTTVYPWDKYVLPLAVFFWYLKSLGLENKFSLFAKSGPAKSDSAKRSSKKLAIASEQNLRL